MAHKTEAELLKQHNTARYFTENVATLKKSLPAVAFDRFEEAFKKLNVLLA